MNRLVFMHCQTVVYVSRSHFSRTLTQGVKNLGLSLELSYTSIRKYALSYLNRLASSNHKHRNIAADLQCTFITCNINLFYWLHSTTSFRAIQCLQFHLGEVLGMARWYDRFGVLGLSEAAVQGTGHDRLPGRWKASLQIYCVCCSLADCINHLGTFALKSQELLL